LSSRTRPNRLRPHGRFERGEVQRSSGSRAARRNARRREWWLAGSSKILRRRADGDPVGTISVLESSGTEMPATQFARARYRLCRSCADAGIRRIRTRSARCWSRDHHIVRKIIRGLRDMSPFKYETQLDAMLAAADKCGAAGDTPWPPLTSNRLRSTSERVPDGS